MSETRLTGHKRIKRNWHKLIYTRGQKHEQYVEILIKKERSTAIEEAISISDRVLLVRMNPKPKVTNLIHVYAPKSDSNDDVIEEAFEEVRAWMPNFYNGRLQHQGRKERHRNGINVDFELEE